jgi:hypothetical protein
MSRIKAESQALRELGSIPDFRQMLEAIAQARTLASGRLQ